uniref:Reverse transcriptase domain-containing protein n=1 Tax=Amphilophus citrinellus TaxID=61819 RepID=A0A3Q0R0Y7_AMPCI
VICFLKDPDTGIPILTNLLERFGFCSGYKLNLTKTQFLMFNYSPPKDSQLKFNINRRTTKMKYRGITLTQRIEELYEANYTQMDTEIRNDLSNFKKSMCK